MKKRIISLLLGGTLLLSSLSPTISMADTKYNVKRIAGSDRYVTSVEASIKTFDKSEYAVVASGEGFADALVGGTLATQIKAPILLVSKNSIPLDVKKELNRLEVNKVFLLGGTSTVSSNTEKELKDLGLNVERLAGKDRVDTAGEIARARCELTGTKNAGDIVSSVSGTNFADSLAAAPFVGQFAIKDEIDTYLNYLYPTKMDHAYMIFGGYNSISDTDTEINYPGSSYRFSGKDRYGTAVEVAKGYKKHLTQDIDTIVLVDGTNYPDALASSPVASMNNGAILLTEPKSLSRETRDYINYNKNIKNIIIVGGTNSVSKNIENLLRNGNIESSIDQKNLSKVQFDNWVNIVMKHRETTPEWSFLKEQPYTIFSKFENNTWLAYPRFDNSDVPYLDAITIFSISPEGYLLEFDTTTEKDNIVAKEYGKYGL